MVVDGSMHHQHMLKQVRTSLCKSGSRIQQLNDRAQGVNGKEQIHRHVLQLVLVVITVVMVVVVVATGAATVVRGGGGSSGSSDSSIVCVCACVHIRV